MAKLELIMPKIIWLLLHQAGLRRLNVDTILEKSRIRHILIRVLHSTLGILLLLGFVATFLQVYSLFCRTLILSGVDPLIYNTHVTGCIIFKLPVYHWLPVASIFWPRTSDIVRRWRFPITVFLSLLSPTLCNGANTAWAFIFLSSFGAMMMNGIHDASPALAFIAASYIPLFVEVWLVPAYRYIYISTPKVELHFPDSLPSPY